MKGGAWAPLRVSAFRYLWMGQLVSNIGTWMFVVGAQWQVADSGGAAMLVGLVQTATSLPVLLLAVPSGWLGDLFDRRRLLLVTNIAMLATSAVIGVVTVLGGGRPWVVLLGTSLLGVGTALLLPTWQAVIPTLVGREQISQAAALGGMSVNLARVIGPAIGGVIVALAGPGWVFLLNALTFLAVVIATWRWRVAPHSPAKVRPHWAGDSRRHGRMPRSEASSSRSLVSLCRLARPGPCYPSWLATNSGLRRPYGVLMAAGGLGAVAGALFLPRIQFFLGSRATLPVAFGLAGTGGGSVLLWQGLPAAGPLAATFVFGVGWLMVMASLNAAAHAAISDEVRARGMSVYVMAGHGGQALGGLLWGAAATQVGAANASAFAAGTLIVAAGVLFVRSPATRGA